MIFANLSNVFKAKITLADPSANMTVLQNIMLAPMQVRGKSKEEAKELLQGNEKIDITLKNQDDYKLYILEFCIQSSFRHLSQITVKPTPHNNFDIIDNIQFPHLL